jgi:hypothetical protein
MLGKKRREHMNNAPEKVVHVHTPKLVAWILTVIALFVVGTMFLLMR